MYRMAKRVLQKREGIPVMRSFNWTVIMEI
jgi:hypothetical protein